MEFYCIDFASGDKPTPRRQLEVLEYPQEVLKSEMKAMGVSRVADLTDYDRVIFNSEEKAERFLEEYCRIHDALTPYKFCVNKNLPAMLYRKRHVIMTAMGFKLQTYRTYRKDWKPGQLFNLFDRTNYITVKLTSLTKAGDMYCYRFTREGI